MKTRRSTGWRSREQLQREREEGSASNLECKATSGPVTVTHFENSGLPFPRRREGSPFRLRILCKKNSTGIHLEQQAVQLVLTRGRLRLEAESGMGISREIVFDPPFPLLQPRGATTTTRVCRRADP